MDKELLEMLRFREEKANASIKFYEKKLKATEFESIKDLCVSGIEREKKSLEETEPVLSKLKEMQELKGRV